jgi:RNA polymerase sigma-B factor
MSSSPTTPFSLGPCEASPYAPKRLPRGPARDARDRELIERAQFAASPAVREDAVAAFMPLVRHLARRYARGDEPLEDLEQVASLGLLKAIAGFDLTRSTSFASYAVPTITGELRRHFRDKGWMVRPPRALGELSLRIPIETQQAAASLGRAPTLSELAVRLGVTDERLLEAREASYAMHATSLDREASGDGGELGDTLVERLGTEDTGYEAVERALTVSSCVRALPRRNRELLYLRFAEDLSQDEIARRLGVSQMHVSRTLRTVLAELRDAVSPTPEPQLAA